MEEFKEYLDKIENDEHLSRIKEVLEWVKNNFPSLKPRLAWNQPMFTDHGTFIISFDVSKNHLSISPENAGIVYFQNELSDKNIEYGSMTLKFKWKNSFDFDLLYRIIKFNIDDKINCNTFWR